MKMGGFPDVRHQSHIQEITFTLLVSAAGLNSNIENKSVEYPSNWVKKYKKIGEGTIMWRPMEIFSEK